MGGMQSQENDRAFYQNLQLIKCLDNSKSLMKQPNQKQQYMVIQHTFPSEQQMKKFYTELQKKKQISHQYYLGPQKLLIFSYNNLCSKQHKVIQIFKSQQYTLNQQIYSRNIQSRQFNDKQIWSILCSCVLAMSYFTKNQIIHITLHPKDIILTNEGQVKIIASQASEYQFDYNYKHGFYYAPQTLKAINSRSLYNVSNKAAVFTLGVTILSTIHCENLVFLYKDNLVIDFYQLNLLIQKISNCDIKQVLIKMLKQAPYQRISFPQLQDMLFSILQKSQLNTQNDTSHQQQNQIQKLQQSIFRLKTKQQNFKWFWHTMELNKDQQDQCNNSQNYLQPDLETLDQADSIQKDKLLSDNHCSYKQSDSNMREPLIDKSNSIQISESLKILDDKKIFNQIESLSKTSRISGPYYVTQQYTRGRYQGYKQNGMRQGFGTFFYEEGGKYCGEWNKNKMQGRGALYYINGQLAYEGQWNLDQLHGYGVLYNQTPNYTTINMDWKNLNSIGYYWVKYEGHFLKDVKYGEGTLFLSNGQYYRGEFQNDQPNGKGIFRVLNGQIIKGMWVNGIFSSFDQ